MTDQDHTTTSATPWFVQFTAFKVDPAWRRLPQGVRADGYDAFAAVVEEYASSITTWAYSGIGLKIGADLLLWRRGVTQN